MTSPLNFCLPAVNGGRLSEVVCPAVFACGSVTKQSIPDPDLLFSLRGDVQGEHLCSATGWKAFRALAQKGWPKGQVGSGQMKAVLAGRVGAPLVCVFNHQICTGDVFGRNKRASCTRALFGRVLLCQDSSGLTSGRLLLQATVPSGAECWAPAGWPWLIPPASRSSSQCPFLSSKVTQ